MNNVWCQKGFLSPFFIITKKKQIVIGNYYNASPAQFTFRNFPLQQHKLCSWIYTHPMKLPMHFQSSMFVPSWTVVSYCVILRFDNNASSIYAEMLAFIYSCDIVSTTNVHFLRSTKNLKVLKSFSRCMMGIFFLNKDNLADWLRW